MSREDSEENIERVSALVTNRKFESHAVHLADPAALQVEDVAPQGGVQGVQALVQRLLGGNKRKINQTKKSYICYI